MQDKKKRGSNYTAAEKEMLLEVIKKYQNIIENKETNTHMITKKRNTWNSICQQYNAVAVSGLRTWQQLRHLYENLKQRSKKKIANGNKEINCTGGLAYKSTLTGQDVQILAMAEPQIKPLSNPYDDAALYFGDVEETNETDREVETPPDFNDSDDYHTTIPNIAMTNNSKKPCTVT